MDLTTLKTACNIEITTEKARQWSDLGSINLFLLSDYIKHVIFLEIQTKFWISGSFNNLICTEGAFGRPMTLFPGFDGFIEQQ